MVRKDKARSVEDALIAAATNNRLREKVLNTTFNSNCHNSIMMQVTEEQLIKMLEGIDEGNEGPSLPKKKVVVQRRKYGFDEDDDDDDSDLM